MSKVDGHRHCEMGDLITLIRHVNSGVHLLTGLCNVMSGSPYASKDPKKCLLIQWEQSKKLMLRLPEKKNYKYIYECRIIKSDFHYIFHFWNISLKITISVNPIGSATEKQDCEKLRYQKKIFQSLFISGQCSQFTPPPENTNFLVFSGGIKWKHWPKICQVKEGLTKLLM